MHRHTESSSSRHHSNRVVWLAVASVLILTVGLTILFAVAPWDRSESPKSPRSAEPDISNRPTHNNAERTKLPNNLCEFVSAESLERLVPEPRSTTPRDMPAISAQNVECDVEPQAGGAPFLTFDVERFDRRGKDEEGRIIRLFESRCKQMRDGGNPGDDVARLPGTNSPHVCGVLEREPESNWLDIRIVSVDGIDQVSVNYSVTADTPTAEKNAAEDALAFVDELVEKLRG